MNIYFFRKVEGLIFGINHCARAIPTGECKAVILDAEIQPQLLVHHVIDACVLANIPFVCLKQLKKMTADFFGFQTCCLGVKSNKNVEEIKNIIERFAPLRNIPQQNTTTKCEEIDKTNNNEDLNVRENVKVKEPFLYLYRNSKETRIFVPSSNETVEKNTKDFSGQSFIGITKNESDIIKTKKNHQYKPMIVKRMQDNPNRKRKIKK